jgi:hypothetical protein
MVTYLKISIYHHRWSNMTTYTSYIPFVRSDAPYIIRYTCRSRCKHV